MKNMSLCKNCSAPVDSKFCPTCGQPQMEIPFTISTLKSWTLDQIDLNKGYFLTLYHIFFKPHKITSEFLMGKTIVYTNPFKYLIITIFLVVLFVQFFPNFYIQDEDDKVNLEWKVYLICSIIFLSFYLISSRFFKNKYGKLDIFIITIYEVSQILLLMVPAIVISGLLKQGDDIFFTVFWLGTAAAYHVYFTLKVFSGSLFKKIVISLIEILMTILLLNIIISLIIMWIKL